LEEAGISYKEYSAVVQALEQATPRGRRKHLTIKYARNGQPIPNATIIRTFGDKELIVEDRGPVYAVWVRRIGEAGAVHKVLGFVQIPWEHLDK
jgi:hypothetical protein